MFGELLMRYKSFVGTGSLSLKSHQPPPIAEPYRILLNSLYFPANNSDIIVMYFLKFSFNEIISDTFGPDNIHGLS